MKIYTIQIAKARKLGVNHDPAYLDITIQSGDKVFAPTWKMVKNYKFGTLTEAGYTKQYLALMRDSYKRYPHRWREILSKEKVILACYCPADTFCHRHLLADMLVKCGAEYVKEIKEEEDVQIY